MGKRMDDWLRNMGDWNISRRRYYGLPLPFYPCACGHLNVIGSKAELAERAIEGFEQLEELRRPWIDRVPIRCEQCGETVDAHPRGRRRLARRRASSRSRRSAGRTRSGSREGYATGAAKGLDDAPTCPTTRTGSSGSRPTGSRRCASRSGSGSTRSSSCRSSSIGRSPYKRVLGYEKMLDEKGREMHSSWGNTIDAEDAFAQMGADVMRWQYCAQPPDRNLLFGFGPGARDQAASCSPSGTRSEFLVDYANIEGFDAVLGRSSSRGARPEAARPLARRADEAARRRGDRGYEATLTVDVIRAFESFVDDVSNWYIRRSRRRFYSFDEAAFRTLWYALVQSLRVIAPVMPFLSDHLWRNLVQDGPASVHLAPWPEPGRADDGAARRDRRGPPRRRARPAGAVDVPAQAAPAAAPARRRRRGDAPRTATPTEIADELRVKEVEFGEVEASELRVKPNLPVLGPKLGAALRDVRERSQRGEFEELDGGRFQVDGHVLEPDEVLVERVGREGWAVASEDGVTVALDTALDDELRLEAGCFDRIHEVNVLRKDSGLELTDRIRLWLPDADLVERFGERLAAETLAVSVELGELRIENVASAWSGAASPRRSCSLPRSWRRAAARRAREAEGEPARRRRQGCSTRSCTTTTPRRGAICIRPTRRSRRSPSTSAARRARR